MGNMLRWKTACVSEKRLTKGKLTCFESERQKNRITLINNFVLLQQPHNVNIPQIKFITMQTDQAVITVETTVNAPVEKVWNFWISPDHITKWSTASDDWHTPYAENDVKPGGKFLSRMEAKDGSVGFDFGGVYDDVKENEHIEYTIGDGRKVEVHFTARGNETKVVETFEAEGTHSIEMQKGGWQAILDNFKKYVEAN